MKSTKLALVIVLLCGALAGCKPEPTPPPAVEAAPPVVEPAPAPEPVMPEPATTTMPPTDAPTDAENSTGEDDDTPHSGGDKVRPASPPAN